MTSTHDPTPTREEREPESPVDSPFPRNPWIRCRGLVLAAACLTMQQMEASPSRQDVLDAMRRASRFFAEQVATQGGCQSLYSSDLTYANAGKGSEGLSQISVTGNTTPSLGMAFLRAWKSTGDPLYRNYALAAAQILMRVQNCSGGWDYTGELDPAKRAVYHYRVDGDCPDTSIAGLRNMTNLDNNSTQAVLRFLMRLDRALDFQDEPLHEAVLFALGRLQRAQYPNGAWPQRYHDFPNPSHHPVKPAAYPESWSRSWPGPIFHSYYTLNDEVSSNMIDVLLEAARLYRDPQYQATAEKAGDFLILAQMPEPQPGWGQQYDFDMRPAWARIFEPPGITGRESLEVLHSLLLLYRETGKRKYLDPIPKAVRYLQRSRVKSDGVLHSRRSWMQDRTHLLARFHEFGTNRPLFVTRGTLVGTRVHFGQPTDGYQVTYDPEFRATHYAYFVDPEGIQEVQKEYDRVRTAQPETLRRPERLEGMTPARDGPRRRTRSTRELTPQVIAALEALDERGAWVEAGDPGGPGRLVRVRAAQDLVVVLDGRVLSPVADGSTLEIFEGATPPRKRVILTGTFLANLHLFCDYLDSPGQGK